MFKLDYLQQPSTVAEAQQRLRRTTIGLLAYSTIIVACLAILIAQFSRGPVTSIGWLLVALVSVLALATIIFLVRSFNEHQLVSRFLNR